MSGNCFVYIVSTIADGEISGPVKIGVANDPAARLASLQTGNPLQLHLTYAFQAHGDREMARIIERVSHEVGGEKRLCGEWFDLHPLDAIRLVAAVIQGVWIESCPKHLMPDDSDELFRVSGIQGAFEFCVRTWPDRMPRGTVQ